MDVIVTSAHYADIVIGGLADNVVLGGVAREVLREMTVPVVMAH